MMVLPVPPFLLDGLLALSLAIAVGVFLIALFIEQPLDYSAFPAIVLVATLLRLSLNVATTRQVLLHGAEGNGAAGKVVETFGKIVVGGNVLVGLVVFLILVIINFVVITKGAGRIAEVAARFTLDAMPGKQMAIDADLNSGQITDEQARTRRTDIGREADFYGAMDGASKFVKGDAMAGILIVLINLIGGLVVGVLQQHMPFSEAVQHFSLLTVGDGLCAQIPALLISVATGILVTRSTSEKDLGNDIASQVLSQEKAPMVAGCVICAFALVPGLPKLPFLVIGAGFVMIGWAAKNGHIGP